jgi:hypothetical protein
MAMGEGSEGCAGEGGSTAARGPATPRRACAPAGGGRAWGGLAWAGAATKAMGPVGPPRRAARAPRPQGPHGHGPASGRRAAGAGVRGERGATPSKP